MESKMVGKKNKKKNNAANSADTAPESHYSTLSGTAPARMMPSRSKPVSASTPPRVLGHPESPVDEFSEPESSLFDYQLMDEAGYSSVGFGTWPSNTKQRRMASTAPPGAHHAGRVGIYSELGEFENYGDGDSTRVIGDISDLYSTPMKKGKGQGKSSTKSAADSQGDVNGLTMTGTHRDVHAAMQKIHDLPEDIEETMKKNVRQNVHISHTYPGSSRQTDSGRGSARGESLAEEEEYTEILRSMEQAPELVNMSEQMSESRRQVVSRTLKGLEIQPDEEINNEEDVRRKNLGLMDNEAIESLIMSSKASGSHKQADLTSLRSARSRTPRSGRGVMSDMELHQLKMDNEEMHGELQSLRKVAEAIRDGDVPGAQTLYVMKQMDDVKAENETLKSSVHRLNVELSDYQVKFRPVDPAQVKQVRELNGLPSRGPVPSWLVNKRYLAPLFLAYDDHLEEKNEVINECQTELANLKKRAEGILKENDKLRRMGGAGLSGQGDTSEWQQLQEQARLVLEENQVLMEQLDVHANKTKDMHQAHMAEISRFARKLALSEGEKADSERELETLRARFRELKHKHDQAVLNMGSHVDVHAHIDTIADLKRSVNEEKEQQEKEVEAVRIKLKASEAERKSQALQVVDLTAENKGLKVEVKAMQKSVKSAQQKMAVLHRAIELSEDKELITQEQLANVIRVAEKTALERDTVYNVAREQQQENKLTVNKMMHGSVAVGKLEEKLKIYRIKASSKLNTVAERLKEQDEAFNSQKKEYEREIQYLRLLLREKEEIINSLEKDKKDIERDLDTMWQAASSENSRVKNILSCGTRKLKDHVHIVDALNEEMEAVELLHFSDDEGNL